VTETPLPPASSLDLVVDPADAGARLDLYLVERLSEISRSRIEGWIEEGFVKVDGEPSKPGLRLKGGERVVVVPPAPRPVGIVPQEIPLSILYEDDDLVAVDKPPDLVVHPAPGHPDLTLVNALVSRISGLAGIGDALRPGILHRLDRDTTGVLLVAKNDAAFQAVARQITARTIRKSYTALVYGRFHERKGEIDRPLGRHPKERKKMAVVPGGKASLTRWVVLEELPRTSLLDVDLVTGRTHQIRVHFAAVGHPVVGDQQYGHPLWKGIPDRRLRNLLGSFPRQALHARRLELVHPRTGEPLVVEAPLPADIVALVAALRQIGTKSALPGRDPEAP
jgi:23S rRNA pseudouridine1911/1915/1917 synthase